jgi:toxin-antitoxin system PIN domain toxin
VIAVDTNILVYAHREDSEWHSAADECLTRLAESGSPWAIPWPCIHEFLAIVTHPKIWRPPTPLKHALLQVECWLECPSLYLIGEIQGYWATLKSEMQAGNISGAMTHDARIVAICRQHGVKALWSADRDLTRFAGVKVINPLVGKSL